MFTFFGVPFAFGASPLTADLVGIFAILRIEFTLADSTFSEERLDSIPLRFGYFHFVDAHRIVDVAVDHPRIHCHSAVCLERSIDTSYHSGFGVERAGATTFHAALSDCD